MKLAAIDIGSNAARLQISSVINNELDGVFLKRVEYVRFPLRLGIDVFKHGHITPHKEEQILKLLQAYRLLMDLHEVHDYMAVATSAMREAANSAAIVERVRRETGIELRVISGDEENHYVNVALLRHLDHKPYLHIDVGGGSTELTLIMERQAVASRSFEIGSIRLLEGAADPALWKEMQKWVEKHCSKVDKLTAVGVGGNINKLATYTKKKGRSITIKELAKIKESIESYTYEERIAMLEMNPDRADVIVPAAHIYLSVMRWAGIKEILVPGVGLRDGLLEMLLEKHGFRKNRMLFDD
ncbi:MAG: exopolyphosphatase [Thermonema sp.]|uniref:Ppx/GppA phosphatase family protein n=1 Tax=Thermonema TaxID=28194 RepID=UPI00057015CB|nr:MULTISPECIES: phosphatase [Thermonema]GIV40442.1 MAG: exopolyphosphatase [Thermonema sp.]